MSNRLLFPAGLAAALLLAACAGQPTPTPTPTQTPAPAATATPAPVDTPTPGALAATIAGGVVAAVADDAVAFVLANGAANVTADQLTAALLGVLGRLREWAAGTGGETALADCRALLPGVIARAQNVEPLAALLAAGWKCIRCGHEHDPTAGYTLTVHHLDLSPANCRWWNLCPLCQRCHLRIQGKVIMERAWYLPHSEWFKPYIAGYYAHVHGLPDGREFVLAHLDDLLAIGQGLIDPAQLQP